MRRLLLLAAILALCACGKKEAPETVDAEGLDMVAQAVADEMNEPPAAIQALLRQAAEQPQVGWDTLNIGVGGQAYPVAAWLYRHGYLQLAGTQYVTRPVFALTEKTRTLLQSPDQPWFDAAAGEATSVNCGTETALSAGGCEVEVVVTPSLTPAGRAALGSPKLEPVTVRAVVAVAEEGWDVPTWGAVGAAPLDIVLNLLLGPEKDREAANRAVLKEVGANLGLEGETPEAAAASQPYQPPAYIEPEPIVPPIQ
jgi:hypothetical protein